jgi:WD40 repeat protein
VWSTADGSPLATLVGHSGVVTSVVFSADGSLLASGSEDDTAVLWGLEQ